MNWIPTFTNWQAGAIAAGIVVPSLLVLYFLKLRRREHAVPSTLLWRKAIQDLQVNAPFQKLRRNLLLLLQMLLLLLLGRRRSGREHRCFRARRLRCGACASCSRRSSRGARAFMTVSAQFNVYTALIPRMSQSIKDRCKLHLPFAEHQVLMHTGPHVLDDLRELLGHEPPHDHHVLAGSGEATIGLVIDARHVFRLDPADEAHIAEAGPPVG